jgi:LysM repeat protein
MSTAIRICLATMILVLGAAQLSAQSAFDPMGALSSTDGKNMQEATTYTVVPGDTLYGIAAKFYGDGYCWDDIFQANRSQIENPDLIYPGQVFQIPRGPRKETPISGTYTTQAGDTLSALAQRLLGSAERWTELYAANADRIKDPANLEPGTELRIPEAAAGPAAPSSSGGSDVKPKPGSSTELDAAARQGGVTTRSPQFAQWVSQALDVAAGWKFPSITNRYGEAVTRADFLRAILFIESRGVHSKPGGRVTESSCGALGFMQLMPATARGLGVNPRDPRDNLLGGSRYIGETLRGPNTTNSSDGPAERLIKAACGYNRGPYASELRDKSWNQYVRTCGVTENVQYGIMTKMCLGLALSGDEVNWMMRHRGLSAGGVADQAESYYRSAHALF